MNLIQPFKLENVRSLLTEQAIQYTQKEESLFFAIKGFTYLARMSENKLRVDKVAWRTDEQKTLFPLDEGMDRFLENFRQFLLRERIRNTFLENDLYHRESLMMEFENIFNVNLRRKVVIKSEKEKVKQHFLRGLSNILGASNDEELEMRLVHTEEVDIRINKGHISLVDTATKTYFSIDVNGKILEQFGV